MIPRQLAASGLACAVLVLALDPGANAQSFEKAHWIWVHGSSAGSRPAGERCVLRRAFTLPSAPRRAVALAAADNHFELLMNGRAAGRGDDWARPIKLDLREHLRQGENVIEARCLNDSAPAGFLFAAELVLEDQTKLAVVSDTEWTSRAGDAAASDDPGAPGDWLPAASIGLFGCAPWGRLGDPEPSCRPDPLPGFRVERVIEGIGSIDALAHGEPGHLFAAVEGRGIVELIDRDGNGDADDATDYAPGFPSHGFLWQGDGLFATGLGPQGLGLYRIERGGAPRKLVDFSGELNEHGPHAVVPGPDGWLYVPLGNHCGLATPSAGSPFRRVYEGHLLPSYVDPRGHAVDCEAPGGVVARFDPATGECQLFAGGFRNHFDLAFDADGRLFTFDSDMEWDIGLPWYRSVRLVHVVPGGEYGWRTGTRCGPASLADTLPPAVETGRGSPTGMCLCSGEQFPPRFRGTILAGDWSQGAILAFRIVPDGASVKATTDVLLRGHPLNVTDILMDRDGSLLFSVGGRGTQGGVHRLVYAGDANDPEPPMPAPADGTGAPVAPAAPSFDGSTPMPELGLALASPDRFVRFAARLELERRDLAALGNGELGELEPLALAEALLAMGRGRAAGVAGRSAPDASSTELFLRSAITLLESGVDGAARLAALRALELLLIEGPDAGPGPPAVDGAPLLAMFPTGDPDADRELAVLLAHLQPAGTAEELLQAFRDEPSRERRIWLVYALRCVKDGWPEGARLEVARWTQRIMGASSVGMSFEGYLRRLRDDVAAGLTESERAELEADAKASAAAPAPSAAAAASAAEPRDLDRTLVQVEHVLRAPDRSLEDGALIYAELCAACHLRGALGKAVGPDLTTVGGRFGLRDLLESMAAPSRTISDQYRGVNVFLDDGDVASGLPLLDDGKTLVLVESSGARREIDAARITARRPAEKSVMPDGLLERLTPEQIADLCAWLLVEPAPLAIVDHSVWRTLFDGETLAGFTADPERWSVVEGAILGRGEGPRLPSPLCLDAQFADFTLEFEMKLGSPDSPAGLVFRARRRHLGRLEGYRAAAGAEEWGALHDDAGRGFLARVKQEVWWPLPDRAAWNHWLVSCRGSRISIRLNGVVTVDLDDPDGPRDGAIGFALPAGGAVLLRNIRIR